MANDGNRQTGPKGADPLGDLFGAAGREQPGEDLMARVLADAAAVQAEAAEALAATKTPDHAAQTGWVSRALAALGGWPAASGVALAGVAGVAVGFYAPDLVDTLVGGQIWALSGSGEIAPDISSLWMESGDV